MPSDTPSPFSLNSTISLAGAPWTDDVPGIRASEAQSGGRRWAIVEYAADARREEWCLDGHVGFVLEGEIEYEFSDGDAPLVVSRGDGFTLATGRGHRGRNLHDGSSRLFLIDDPVS